MNDARPITFADIAHLPPPGYVAPAAPRFSPDGRFVTYLWGPPGALSRELWAYDRETGTERRLMEPPADSATEAGISREEALRRERLRQLTTGVTGYAWSRTGDTLMAVVRGEVFVRLGHDGDWRPAGGGPGCIDPQLSRDGACLAFVRDAELYTQRLDTPDAAPVRVTFDASPADQHGDRLITNGLAEYIAQEEMGRFSGFWWAPDGAKVAFAQVDHTPVPLFLIPHFGGDGVEVEAHRYPFAGQANVTLRLGVVAADGGPVRWLAAGDLTDRYLARVHWTPDGLLLLQVQSRDQTRLEVRRVNPTTGETRTLWVEDCRPWINLTDDLTFVQVEGAADADYTILWSSERTGRRELYLYDRDGAPLHQITRARVLIDGVRGVDAAGGWVYYDGWRETPLERHLFRSPLAGGAAEQVTHEAGAHLCVLAKDCSAYVDVYDSVTAPPTATIRAIGGAWSARLQPAAVDARVGALALRPPDFITVTTRDGVTLHGAVYRPPAVAPGSKAPVVVSVYGGPHAQRVANTWALTADLRAQYYAQQGFVVVRIDNRGSARRGLAFEGAIHRNMGAIEVQDQADGVRALADLIPEADLDRVGVYGWSYGGYMALMCLARAPELFKAGIAGAPVTHWDGYDTHYTERYMGTPADNPEGYRISSVMAHVEAVRGRLLLVHGMIDENVHFRHTGRLLTALIRARVPYELQLFPAERHTPRREEDRVFMEQRMAAFLQQCLRQ